MDPYKGRRTKTRLYLSARRKKNKGTGLLNYLAKKKALAEEQKRLLASTSNCVEAIETHKTKNFLVEGRRIVDINHLISAIKALDDNHGQLCALANMELIDEARDGLQSFLHYKCNQCNYEQKVCTNESACDINECFAMSTGCGYAQLEQLLASIEVPFMSDTN